MIKKMVFIVLMFILLCACREGGLTTKNNTNIDISSSNIIEVKSISNEKKLNKQNKRMFNFDIKSFVEFKKAIIKTDFKSDKKDNDLDSPYHITGSYDLNSDGKIDSIKAILCRRVNNQDSYIQINDNSFKITFENPGEVYLVDFDKRDEYIELAVFDDGPSGDPILVIFRYNGNEIIKLGVIAGDPLNNTIRIDSLGRVISPWDTIEFVSPAIILGISELDSNKFSRVEFDYSESLNREYTIASDFKAFFKEMESIPSSFSPSFTPEDKEMEFKKGDKIVMIKIDDECAWFGVELNNSKKGVLYFWIGD